MSKSMVIRLFAGVPSDGFDAVPLLLFGRWLLSVGIFLLIMGFYAKRDEKVEMLSLYRYGTVKSWWKRHFGKGVASGVKAAGLPLLLALAWDMVMGNLFALSAGLLAKISILWLFHCVSMAALFAVLDLFPVRRFVPGALLLLEGLTFAIGYRVHAVSHGMYGMWGMYLQSSLCEAGGFPAGAAIAAEAILLAASFLVGREYLKKETDFITIKAANRA